MDCRESRQLRLAEFGGEVDGLVEAGGVGDGVPGDGEGGAVGDGGADDGEAEGDVDAGFEGEGF